VARAKELLGSSRKSLKEVARTVGYGSHDQFRIAFRKATGLSPRLWRETMLPTPTP
jgi:transcriptional regulator GlxA family with amidase domain